MISEDRNGVSFGCLIPMSRVSVTTVASSSSSSLLHLHSQTQDALWEMNPRSREQMEPGSYPVCEDGQNCSYYIRTGLCRFGATCRFNRPPNWKLAIATSRMRGEYPERIGQPECQICIYFYCLCLWNHFF